MLPNIYDATCNSPPFGLTGERPCPHQDMADSRRINSNIREEESKLGEEEQPPLSLSAIILSSEFWPALKEEKLELPPVVCQAMEAYTHRYEKLKVDATHRRLIHVTLVLICTSGDLV